MNAVIFSYTFGDTATETIPSKLACDNKGIYTHIPDNSASKDLVGEMRQYYNYLARGLELKEAVWSDVYPDSITGLDFITASFPIYVDNKHGKKVLLGVAAVDI